MITPKDKYKYEILRHIFIIVLLSLCIVTLIAIPIIASSPGEIGSIYEKDDPMTIEEFLNHLFKLFQEASDGTITFIVITWITIKIFQLVHFFKLFSIHNETKRTNESLEKIIAIQQEQLDFLMGKKKDDEVTIKISKEQLDNLLGKKSENL